MTLHTELTDAAGATALVVDHVTPAELGGPTPCAEWDVQTLLNHVILWTSYSLERRAQGESVAPELMERDFAAAPDYADAYRAQLDRAVAAWADPAVWDRELDVMGAKTAAADVAALMIAELVLHGWDLAAATGQHYSVSDRAAEAALRAVEANAELFRQYKGFADPLPTAPGAPVLDRALALSGRDPAWTADR
ncbi:MAG: TIGR03086 family metal-binding protein [Trebonia sp.]|jgi:uncharacterized protein (TIGR03086 family)